MTPEQRQKAREELWDHNQHPIRKRLRKRTRYWQEIIITPRLAYRWLLNSKELSKATKKPFNRPIWLKQVKSVARLIARGKFPESFKEDPIVIGTTTRWGRVICNGQHRIMAIAWSGQYVKAKVILDEPLDDTAHWIWNDWMEATDQDFELIPEPEWLKDREEDFTK
jgi:hypothetical protein